MAFRRGIKNPREGGLAEHPRDPLGQPIPNPWFLEGGEEGVCGPVHPLDPRLPDTWTAEARIPLYVFLQKFQILWSAEQSTASLALYIAGKRSILFSGACTRLDSGKRALRFASAGSNIPPKAMNSLSYEQVRAWR